METLRWTMRSPDNGEAIELLHSPTTLEGGPFEESLTFDDKDREGPLLFCKEGGGLEFIESIYRTYDINGTVYLSLGENHFEAILSTYRSDGWNTSLLVKRKTKS